MKFKSIRKADGVADINDFVRYFDIANQNSDVWKVIDYPKAGRILDNGFQLPDIGYKIINVESEDLFIHYSDLRQQGWDIVEKVEA
jgi:hypothetical protein